MSVEELTVQLDALRIERDAQVAGLVGAVQSHEATIAALKAHIDELAKQIAEKDGLLAVYKEAVLDQIRRLLK